jgi:hypothetical protein
MTSILSAGQGALSQITAASTASAAAAANEDARFRADLIAVNREVANIRSNNNIDKFIFINLLTKIYLPIDHFNPEPLIDEDTYTNTLKQLMSIYDSIIHVSIQYIEQHNIYIKPIVDHSSLHHGGNKTRKNRKSKRSTRKH